MNFKIKREQRYLCGAVLSKVLVKMRTWACDQPFTLPDGDLNAFGFNK